MEHKRRNVIGPLVNMFSSTYKADIDMNHIRSVSVVLRSCLTRPQPTVLFLEIWVLWAGIYV